MAELRAPAVALAAAHLHGPALHGAGQLQQLPAVQAGQPTAVALLGWVRGAAMDHPLAAVLPTAHSWQPS